MTVSRRQFFQEVGQALTSHVVSACEVVGRTVPVFAGSNQAPQAKWLRPPGALDEKTFLATCTQCTDCQTACPYDSIRRLGPEFGLHAGTPVIIPEESPCYLCEDMPCIPVCEPGALLPVERREVAMGTAMLNRAKCYLAQGQPCDYCFARCPLKDVAITFASDGLPVINENGCAGCGVCVFLCPGDALSIKPAHTD